jgi:hypothetical protein
MAGIPDRPDEHRSRIADAWRSRIGDKGDAFAVVEHPADPLSGLLLIVGVAGNQAFFDSVGVEQLQAVPGVFAGDGIHLPEYVQGPQGDIPQVSDRGGDHV